MSLGNLGILKVFSFLGIFGVFGGIEVLSCRSSSGVIILAKKGDVSFSFCSLTKKKVNSKTKT
ncbi:hypothetical protein JZK55_04260 [Dissulfurispira thermophila]|uniref:Uncharacterized protein n=1 Tax=Dissulfurispira thermophila TaxID=2715679 RepID=A0A7G1GYQ3_9BACT|nr:hypothetical protein JZK55_04260 [Dissulfurispira thermophila]